MITNEAFRFFPNRENAEFCFDTYFHFLHSILTFVNKYFRSLTSSPIGYPIYISITNVLYANWFATNDARISTIQDVLIW